MPADLLFRTDPYLQQAAAIVTASGADGIRLDRTIFYPLGGGQPGDSGMLRWTGGELPVIDARKYKAEAVRLPPDQVPGTARQDGEDVLHIPQPGAVLPAPGTPVELSLDWPRRYAHMRMHTCLHLLSALLPGIAVTGGQVGAEKSRLDFDLPAGQLDKDELAEALNRLILEDHAVAERWISDEEMAAQPELVRTMSVKPPVGYGQVRLLAIGNGVDLQPCGGTHVRRTGEIGPVTVAKIENKGKQNRRIVIALLPPQAGIEQAA